MNIENKNPVTEIATRASNEAAIHFATKLAHETDCWDVHATQDRRNRGFVLVDVRSSEAFGRGHLPGAINIPRWKLTADRLADYPLETLFVVYCAGPHCNASTRAAASLARLDRPVKEMIGGITGWLDEGFQLVTK